MTSTRIIAVASSSDPAAGAEFTAVTVPAGATYELVAVRFSLVTDGTASTRRVALIIDDGTNTLVRIPAANTQAASLTYAYSYAVDVDSASQAVNEVVTKLPRLVLPGGFRVRTDTANLAAGDNYGVAVYAYIP